MTVQHNRYAKQETTKSVGIRSVIYTREFNLGVADGSKGLPYRPEYERWTTNDQWNYERGRLFGIATKGEVPVKINKKVTQQAIMYCNGLIAANVIR